jgi:predicted SAM-dependent methyltransferase
LLGSPVVVRERETNSLLKVNLGCPKRCSGWTCIDKRGEPQWDVYDWLEAMKSERNTVTELRTKNLLEHLPDPGSFLRLCRQVLQRGGKFTLITDNAAFIPFYFAIWVRHFGVGAHSVNRYAVDNCNSVHYMVFTKMHLENLLNVSGFTKVTVRPILMGSRLEARATR